MNTHGQSFMLELMAAAIIFTALVIGVNQRYEADRRDYEYAFFKATDRMALESAVDQLANSTGNPYDWPTQPLSSVKSVGLLNRAGLWDPNKVRTFVTLLNDPETYPAIRQKINMGTYDLFVRMTQPVYQHGPEPTRGGGAEVDCTCGTTDCGAGANCYDVDSNRGVSKIDIPGIPTISDPPACGGFRVSVNPLQDPCRFSAMTTDTNREVFILKRSGSMISPFTKQQEVRMLEFDFSTPV